MNRLHHLKETLLQNLIDNDDYEELEFVILNYNSDDGMDAWIKEFIIREPSSSKISYYYTKQPKKFSHSHSKNVAFKLAKGEIVCNINADHFTGKGFAHFVNDCFSENKKIVLTTVDYHKTLNDYHPPSDIYGKVCVMKQDFLRIGGFDEQMQGYGFEDWDFVNRLELSGLQREFIKDYMFFTYIKHSDAERHDGICVEIQTKELYVQYICESASALLVCDGRGGFKLATIVDNFHSSAIDWHHAYLPYTAAFNYSLWENDWIYGRYSLEAEKSFKFFIDSKLYKTFFKDNDGNLVELDSPYGIYYLIKDEIVKKEILEFDKVYFNRCRMEAHLFNKSIVANGAGFGNVILEGF